jgi:hypothetical protein
LYIKERKKKDVCRCWMEEFFFFFSWTDRAEAKFSAGEEKEGGESGRS